MKNLKKRKIMAVGNDDFNDCRNIIVAIPNTVDAVNHSYLINETYSINNGVLLTKYKKASYFHEADTQLSNGALYEFGNGRDEKISGVAGHLYAAILDNITTEICFDLCRGIRKENGWRNYKLGGQDSLLHIVQSNTIDPFDDDVSNNNINMLPLNKCVIHADPYVNPYTKLSFVQDIAGRVVDHSNGDGVLLLHSVVIGDSIYTISVCKM